MLALLLGYAALCDPHFDRREAAESRLTHIIDRHPAAYGPRLAEWCRGCSCPETRTRCLRVLAGYGRWRVSSYAPSVPWPICDAFPLACPVIPFGLEDVRDRHRWPVTWCAESKGGPHWTAYRRTTEQRVREAIREGMSHAEADEIVRRMWALALEVRAKHDCGVTFWRGGERLKDFNEDARIEVGDFSHLACSSHDLRSWPRP